MCKDGPVNIISCSVGTSSNNEIPQFVIDFCKNAPINSKIKVSATNVNIALSYQVVGDNSILSNYSSNALNKDPHELYCMKGEFKCYKCTRDGETADAVKVDC